MLISSAVTHYLCVVDVHREPASWNPKHWRIIKEAGETLCVQGRAGHQDLQVGTEAGNIFDQTKENVCV